MTKKGGKRRGSYSPKRRGRSPPSSKASSDANLRMRLRITALEAQFSLAASEIGYIFEVLRDSGLALKTMQESQNLILEEE